MPGRGKQSGSLLGFQGRGKDIPSCACVGEVVDFHVSYCISRFSRDAFDLTSRTQETGFYVKKNIDFVAKYLIPADPHLFTD